MELYLHSSNTPSQHGAALKHGNNFAFSFGYKPRTITIIIRMFYVKCDILQHLYDTMIVET